MIKCVVYGTEFLNNSHNSEYIETKLSGEYFEILCFFIDVR